MTKLEECKHCEKMGNGLLQQRAVVCTRCGDETDLHDLFSQTITEIEERVEELKSNRHEKMVAVAAAGARRTLDDVLDILKEYKNEENG